MSKFALHLKITTIMNKEAELAWQIIETTGTNLFLTGRAGTGKTTFLRSLKEKSKKRLVVVAPTGIAAINAEGTTIHSFFQLPFAPYIPESTFNLQNGHYRFSKEKIKLIQSIDMLVIDEISMVRADLLDAVDNVLRRYRRSGLPFGGVQMVMIGDLGQLSPVVRDEEWSMLSRYYDTPYFFSSIALRKTDYAVVELKKIYRQDDASFIDILNKVRDNKADAGVLKQLNSRYVPGFKPSDGDGYINLTTHNAQAQRINEKELEDLPGRPFAYAADIEGKYPEMLYPTDAELTLKNGAQVMFVKNDSSPEKRYYNGMLGHVCRIDDDGFSVRPNGTDETIDVGKEEWTNSRYAINDKTKEITEEVEGTFRQFPVKTAWAITIHKSQGLTFEHAIINAGASFAHGQAYVALSRCKSLDGLVLSAPLPQSAIIRDPAVDSFVADAYQHLPDSNGLQAMQKSYFLKLVSELFDFSPITNAFSSLLIVVSGHLVRSYPKLATELKARNAALMAEVTDVAKRFHKEYESKVKASSNCMENKDLQERLSKGAAYFYKKISETGMFVKQLSVKSDNKEVMKRLDESINQLKEQTAIKARLLELVRQNGFSVDAYLHEKAIAMLSGKGTNSQTKPEKKPAKQKEKAQKTTEEITLDEKNIGIFNALAQWRKEKAAERGLPTYCIMSQKSLIAAANTRPSTIEELAAIPYFGQKRAESSGEEILKIIKANAPKS